MALIGGRYAPPGRIMGHAGAWTAPGEPGPEEKYNALERAGAVMVNHPEKFGEGMRTLLTNRPSAQGSGVSTRLIIHESLEILTAAVLHLRNTEKRHTHNETAHLYSQTPRNAAP